MCSQYMRHYQNELLGGGGVPSGGGGGVTSRIVMIMEAKGEVSYGLWSWCLRNVDGVKV